MNLNQSDWIYVMLYWLVHTVYTYAIQVAYYLHP